MAIIDLDLPSGPYTVTWNSNDIGLSEGPIRHQQRAMGIPVRASLYGDTVLDYILRGAEVFVALVLKEWNANTKAALWPYGSTHGVMTEAGVRASSLCKALVLTAVSGTPAATEGPLTRTYANAVLLPGHNLDVIFGPEERNIPLIFAVLPDNDSSGNKKVKFFTDT